MLIFSTRLIVNESLTRDVFIGLITEWLNNNRNYKFGQVIYDGSAEFTLNVDTDCLEIFTYPEALTVRLTSNCDGVIWTNDYVLTQVDGRNILAMQLYSDAADLSVRMPESFNKPRILRQVVQNGYGGMDGDLLVSDVPFMITQNNVDIARKLILRESEHFMPVIYVTYPRYAIDPPIDFTAMAKNLAGIAHVVVEAKELASIVRKETGGHNPYAGAADIFYGTYNSYRVIPHNYDSLEAMQSFIENSVQQKILMTKIEDELSWMKIHFTHLQAENKEDPELIGLYEKMLKEAENEGELKKQHIDELESHIKELETRITDLMGKMAQKDSQIQTYKYHFEQSGKARNADIRFEASERELYIGEIKDIILKVLDKERNSMDSDPNLVISRKFHVLENLLNLNTQTGKAEEISECLRDIIDKSGNLNVRRKHQLAELGFEVQIGTHYKIIFNEDERYAFTLAKTASEYRSNLNTLKDAVNALFGR